jgi:hypothetical protein
VCGAQLQDRPGTLPPGMGSSHRHRQTD